MDLGNSLSELQQSIETLWKTDEKNHQKQLDDMELHYKEKIDEITKKYDELNKKYIEAQTELNVVKRQLSSYQEEKSCSPPSWFQRLRGSKQT